MRQRETLTEQHLSTDATDTATSTAASGAAAPRPDNGNTQHSRPHQRGRSGMGEVLRPGSTGYREASGSLFATGTPDLIVQPRDAEQVAAAVRYAVDAGLTISVRSGGHSVAGLSTHSDGMLIDLGLLDGVEVIDPDTRRVRIGAGATWGEVAAALRPHGLGITAGDTREVGVGGLTLGGGIGWMVRKHGLAIDSLVAAEVVLADGRTIRVDQTQHAELLWALRGGGGNFGIVTEFEFLAQQVDLVHYGTLVFDVEGVPGLVRRWRDAMRTADENLSSSLVLVPPMPEQPATAMVLCCYAGDPDRGDPDPDTALAPLRGIGRLRDDTVRQVPYGEALEAAPPPGMTMIMRNTFVPNLSDDAVDTVAATYDAGHAMIALRSLGGALARIDARATAFAHRDAEVLVIAMVVIPAQLDRASAHRLEDQLRSDWDAVAPWGSGAYGNFLDSATEQDTALVYPEATRRRLVTVKRRYDPRNVFRRNHNVIPDTDPGPDLDPDPARNSVGSTAA